MLKNFDKSLLNLKNSSVHVSATNEFSDPGMAWIQLRFSDASKLRASYWRVTKVGKAGLSSFDHQQQYGLPAPIDAIKGLQELLEDKIVIDVHLDRETGDLLFQFADNIKLQVFNFTGYEVWEISFATGGGEYSNYAK